MATKKDTSLTAPATTAKPAKTAVSNLVLGNADDALRLAAELQKFVKANKLTSNIQGKEFPNVEAWQFAGGLLGLSSMLESIEDRSTDTEIKWQATVQVLHIATGDVVGRGFATCSNKESTKKFFADYAIASMAQTRAVGKAYRLSLGWLMKAAGYEATPAEEMSEVGTGAELVVTPAPTAAAPEAPAVQPPADVKRLTLDDAIKAVLKMADKESLTALWKDNNLKQFKGQPVFDLTMTATGVRFASPDYNSPEQADKEVASRGQRDFAHKLLSSHLNDGYRLEALHLLSDAGLSWAQCKGVVDKAQANTKVPSQTRPVEITASTTRPTTDEQGRPIVYATPSQKQEIIDLLNNPLVTRQEKAKMLGGINRLTQERAVQAIAKLSQAIADRESTTAVAA